MDASKIFIIVLSASFFGFVVYLAVMSRRNIRAEALKPETRTEIEPVKSVEQRPRNVA